MTVAQVDDYDIAVIGSGAGAGPVIYTLSRAGYRVIVLEKGPWLTEADFFKDELACCRRDHYTPTLKDEPHVLEERNDQDEWVAEANTESGWSFWNGNCVGGSSNFMSGFFYRLKPDDFRLLSRFGPIAGANIADWPISYADLEPYYTQAESLIGISGRVVAHPFAEPRSTPDFPYPPTAEHILAKEFDAACQQLQLTPIPTPRAILSRPAMGRRSCEYSGYCGSYGCASGAKGSSRAALINHAVATGYCKIQARSQVTHLQSDEKGQVVAAHYRDAQGQAHTVKARYFVVACQAIETARLLLASTGSRHPQGLGNRYQQVGKNLIFSAGGLGGGDFFYQDYPAIAEALRDIRPFVNRGLQDWYYIQDAAVGGAAKGGTIDFLMRHPNPIAQAETRKRQAGNLIWGSVLKQRLKAHFHDNASLRFEVFCDWLPTDNCFVTLDTQVKDQWGQAVAKIRLGYHPHDLKIGHYLAKQAERVLKQMGAKNIYSHINGSPPANLVAGGCRFGTDPKTSVLDADCRVHGVDNLFVSDGSFMPTGGSVPFTWTIYANSLRVADKLLAQLGGPRRA